jgi:phage shock protein E
MAAATRLERAMTKATSRTPRFRGEAVDFVVDVRSKLEFWMGHLPGAVCIPVDQLPVGLERRKATPESRIMVYCASGARSANAASLLRTSGYKHVVDGGGMSDAWNHYMP